MINNEVKNYLESKDSTVVLATVDVEGTPHAVSKSTFQVVNDMQIRYLELFEGSRTSKNMTRSLWFNDLVSISVVNGKKNYQIKGVPFKYIVAGNEYEKMYDSVQESGLNDDLAGIYYINVVDVIDQSVELQNKKQKNLHPLYMHLDKIRK